MQGRLRSVKDVVQEAHGHFCRQSGGRLPSVIASKQDQNLPVAPGRLGRVTERVGVVTPASETVAIVDNVLEIVKVATLLSSRHCRHIAKLFND